MGVGLIIAGFHTTPKSYSNRSSYSNLSEVLLSSEAEALTIRRLTKLYFDRVTFCNKTRFNFQLLSSLMLKWRPVKKREDCRVY